MRKNIGILGWVIAALLFVACNKGPTGDTGPQGPQGTQGSTLPSVLWTSPVPGDANVPLDNVVRAGFSTAMDASTLNTSTFIVYVGGIQITGTISYNSGSQIVYFSPGLPLTGFTYCSAVLTTGVKATDGTALPQNYTWSFTTGGSFAPSRLYVSTGTGGNSIAVYNNAGVVNGNILPDRVISGGATTFNLPTGIWLDKAADRLYVSNNLANSILVFNNASTASGGPAPNRTLSAGATTLNAPRFLWLDPVSDRLYVVNAGAGSILVFNNASTASGGPAPSRTITGGGTYFTAPNGIWLDSAADRLYVADAAGNNIVVFNNASTANGTIAPNRVIGGAGTNLTAPTGIWLDSAADRLYAISFNSNSVVVFNNASSINGNIAPNRVIAGGNTTIVQPFGIWLDTATDRLYIGNYWGGNLLVFNNASTANGNIAPSRTISGAPIGNPFGLWLDSD